MRGMLECNNFHSTCQFPISIILPQFEDVFPLLFLKSYYYFYF